jgi:hypothetical protein
VLAKILSRTQQNNKVYLAIHHGIRSKSECGRAEKILNSKIILFGNVMMMECGMV